MHLTLTGCFTNWHKMSSRLDYDDLLIAEEWLESLQDIGRLINTMVKHNNELKAKEDANKKTISIKDEQIIRIRKFVEAARNVVDRQADMLKEYNDLNRKHKLLMNDYQILRAFAISKGLDVSLTQYMILKDFKL
jgi:hypothetical protein